MRADRRTFLQVLPAAALAAAGVSAAAAPAKPERVPRAAATQSGFSGDWFFLIDAVPPAADGDRTHHLIGRQRAIDTAAVKQCFACKNAATFFGFAPGVLLFVGVDLNPVILPFDGGKLWAVKFVFSERSKQKLEFEAKLTRPLFSSAHFKRLGGGVPFEAGIVPPLRIGGEFKD